jgi:hypothetical protein
LSVGGSTDKKVRKHIRKQNNTNSTVQTIQNTVNTGIHITKSNTHYKIHTYVHPHITKLCTHTPTRYKISHTHTHTLQKKLKLPQYHINKHTYLCYFELDARRTNSSSNSARTVERISRWSILSSASACIPQRTMATGCDSLASRSLCYGTGSVDTCTSQVRLNWVICNGHASVTVRIRREKFDEYL